MDRALGIFNKLAKCRGDTNAEYRALLNAGGKDEDMVSSKLSERVDQLESKMLNVLEKLPDQEKALERLAAIPVRVPAEGLEADRTHGGWTEVVRRPKKAPPTAPEIVKDGGRNQARRQIHLARDHWR